MNIFASTATSGQQPPYVSINERDDVVTMSVRGATSPHVSYIALTDAELAKMAASINAYLNAKQGGQ